MITRDMRKFWVILDTFVDCGKCFVGAYMSKHQILPLNYVQFSVPQLRLKKLF